MHKLNYDAENMKLKKLIKQNMILRTLFNNKCLECNETPLIYDETHGELFCCKCGLIQNELLTKPRNENHKHKRKQNQTRFKPDARKLNNLNNYLLKGN